MKSFGILSVERPEVNKVKIIFLRSLGDLKRQKKQLYKDYKSIWKKFIDQNKVKIKVLDQ